MTKSRSLRGKPVKKATNTQPRGPTAKGAGAPTSGPHASPKPPPAGTKARKDFDKGYRFAKKWLKDHESVRDLMERAAIAAKDIRTPLPKGFRVIPTPGFTGAQAAILGDCVFLAPNGEEEMQMLARLVAGKARRLGLLHEMRGGKWRRVPAHG